MKKKIVATSLLLFLFAAQALAQETGEPAQRKPKRFSMGVQAMMIHTPDYGPGISDFGIGFSMKYFLGKRMAVTAQFNSTRSTNSNFYNAKISRNAFDVPVLLEYHLLPGSKIRPFFSAGGGMTSQHTSTTFNDGQPSVYNYSQTAFLQAGYGMSFEVGKRMVLTTQLFYRYNVNHKQHGMGISIGLGWRRYKK